MIYWTEENSKETRAKTSEGQHSSINETIDRALATDEIPSRLEQRDACWVDGKCLDQVTLVMWKFDTPLLWDTTCACTCVCVCTPVQFMFPVHVLKQDQW